MNTYRSIFPTLIRKYWINEIDFHPSRVFPRDTPKGKKMKQRTLVLIVALFVTLVCAAQAQAQAARTFVSVAGNDA